MGLNVPSPPDLPTMARIVCAIEAWVLREARFFRTPMRYQTGAAQWPQPNRVTERVNDFATPRASSRQRSKVTALTSISRATTSIAALRKRCDRDTQPPATA